MLERFLKLSEPINKMLDESNLTSQKLETHKLQIVKEIEVELKPFKVATTHLCDLFKAEEIIEFISGELQKTIMSFQRDYLIDLMIIRPPFCTTGST